MNSSGIVSIIKTTKEGNVSVGTGFFANKPGLILTCYHVLKNANCYSVGSQVGFMFEGQSRVNVARLGEFDLSADVAILHTDLLPSRGYSLSSSGKIGDTFNTLGFPEGSLSGVVAQPLYERKSPDGLIELKNANAVCKGFSGAPLLDANGAVAGMIRIIPHSLREGGSLLCVARAIPIETIINLFFAELSETQPRVCTYANNLANDVLSREDNNINGREEINLKKTITSSREKLVVTKSVNDTWQSKDMDNLAKETFGYLMRIWLDKTDSNISCSLMLDSIETDFVVELPSMRLGMSSIQTFWQIKSSSKRMEKHYHSELDVECFRLVLPKKTIDFLRESSRQHKHYYFAFAHNLSNTPISELCQCTPQERFEWYCVDLSQQLDNDEQNYIVIPTCNKFNLSTFSLLWSSLWVENFYSPLYGAATIEIPNLMDTIRLTHPYKNEHYLDLENWNSLSQKLSAFEGDLGKIEYSKISFPLGIGYALEVVKRKLYETASNLNTIKTYCPESLYGTINLWLFSRAYHGFMTASGQVVTPDVHNSNLRILPLPDEPKNISGIVKACLWHIILLYSSLNVEVRIIYQPSLDAGADHSYYGGGIGYFPWLSFSDDGVTWMIENSADATNGQHLDFINKYMDNLYIDPYHSNLWEVANNFNLHVNDLSTAPKCPIKLFPKQGRFIEYPYFIFGNYAFRSINSVKQKLLL